MKKLSKFWKSEEGATAIEYALIAAGIAIAIIVGINTLGSGLNDTFGRISCSLSGGTWTAATATADGSCSTTTTGS